MFLFGNDNPNSAPMFGTKEQLFERAKLFFESFLNLCVVIRVDNPSWRKGQTYFNVLAEVRPDIAEMIRGTNKDPFYNDKNITEFLWFVHTHWNNGIPNKPTSNKQN